MQGDKPDLKTLRTVLCVQVQSLRMAQQELPVRPCGQVRLQPLQLLLVLHGGPHAAGQRPLSKVLLAASVQTLVYHILPPAIARTVSKVFQL